MKKHFKILVVSTLVLISTGLWAQENIANNSNATFTASTDRTPFGPPRLNDGQINACGFQECWVSGTGGGTAEWILATFNQAEDVNAVKIYFGEKDSRYLSGATIQYWDGSAYVDHYTYTIAYNNTSRQDNPCDVLVNFPRVNTERIRITKWDVSGAQQSNPNFREIEMYNLRGADAGFSSILPLFAAGSQDVQGTLTNFSYLDLDSVNVDWSVNGTAQTGFKVTSFGSDNVLKDTIVDLGNYNFTANTDYDVKVWTSLPNGIVDSVLTNDTFTLSFKAVGKPAPPTLDDQTYCGVSAPLLKGTSPVDTDINWYADALSTVFIGTSDSIQLTQTISPTDTVAFYGRSVTSLKLEHDMAPLSGTWSYGGTLDRGAFVNITPKYDMTLDSLDVGFTGNNTTTAGPYDVDVYWKTGLHNGFETNAAAWTLAATTNDVTFATTPAANGKLEVLQRKDEDAPLGWIQDDDGQSTTNAHGIKEGGSWLPLGGTREHGSHKGYILGSVVDIFSAVLSGANYGPWAPPFVAYLEPAANPPGEGLGHFFGAMRVDAFRPADDFKYHMDNWIRRFRNAEPADPQQPVVIPGDPERAMEKERMANGITLLDPVEKDLMALGQRFHVTL